MRHIAIDTVTGALASVNIIHGDTSLNCVALEGYCGRMRFDKRPSRAARISDGCHENAAAAASECQWVEGDVRPHVDVSCRQTPHSAVTRACCNWRSNLSHAN